MRSIATKNPEPRETELPRESNVSIATAEGLMRRTSSGRKSCANALPAKAKKHAREAIVNLTPILVIRAGRNSAWIIILFERLNQVLFQTRKPPGEVALK
jgi:hypothetical protein